MGRTLFDPLLTRFSFEGEQSRMKNKRQKTFIVTTLVDYKIKSFEKRVARDKSPFKDEASGLAGSVRLGL
jgi:hypothetical protein